MIIGGEHRPILLTAPNQYATTIIILVHTCSTYHDSSSNFIHSNLFTRGDGTFCTAAVEGDKIVKAVSLAAIV